MHQRITSYDGISLNLSSGMGLAHGQESHDEFCGAESMVFSQPRVEKPSFKAYQRAPQRHPILIPKRCIMCWNSRRVPTTWRLSGRSTSFERNAWNSASADSGLLLTVRGKRYRSFALVCHEEGSA